MFRTENYNVCYRVFLLFFEIGELIPYLFSIILITGVFYILIHPLMQSLKNLNARWITQNSWRIFVFSVYFVKFLVSIVVIIPIGCYFVYQRRLLCDLFCFLYSMWRFHPPHFLLITDISLYLHRILGNHHYFLNNYNKFMELLSFRACYTLAMNLLLQI